MVKWPDQVPVVSESLTVTQWHLFCSPREKSTRCYCFSKYFKNSFAHDEGTTTPAPSALMIKVIAPPKKVYLV